MREFFGAIGRGFLAMLKYIWVPVSLFLLYLGLWALIRFGAMEAIVDWLNASVNGIGESMFSEWEVLWAGFFWNWLAEANIPAYNFLLVIILGIPVLVLCTLAIIAQLIFCVIKCVFSIIIILLLIILVLLFQILMVFVIPPALGVFAFIVTIKFIWSDDHDAVQSVFMIISCVLCVILAVGYYFAIWPYTFGL